MGNFELHHDNDTYDEVGRMMDFEQGELNEADTVVLFQKLMNSGLVWQLQGAYGRFAMQLLQRGLIKRK